MNILLFTPSLCNLMHTSQLWHAAQEDGFRNVWTSTFTGFSLEVSVQTKKRHVVEWLNILSGQNKTWFHNPVLLLPCPWTSQLIKYPFLFADKTGPAPLLLHWGSWIWSVSSVPTTYFSSVSGYLYLGLGNGTEVFHLFWCCCL